MATCSCSLSSFPLCALEEYLMLCCPCCLYRLSIPVMVWIIGMQSAGHSGICVWRNRHVQVYWNTLLILPVITLALVSALLLASFFLSPGSVSLNVSHLSACSLSLPVSLNLVHPQLLPRPPPYPHLSLPTVSPLPSSAASFPHIFIIILPTLTSAFLFCHL